MLAELGLRLARRRWWRRPCPRAIRLQRPLRAARAAASEHERSPSCARMAAQEPGLPLVHRHGLLTTAITPAGDPAQRAREPRLVHAVHALPGRDRAGAARGAAQLPDDGGGPDGAAARERVAARRGHGRRRGDGACAAALAEAAARTASSSPRTATRRRSRWSKTRAEPLGVEVRVGRARRGRLRGPGPVRRARAVPDDRRRACATYAPLAERAHARGRAGGGGDRPARAHAADARRASWAPTSRVGSSAALRRAAGLRRAARGLLRDARRVQAPDAGPHRRRLEGRGGPHRLSPGAADPRAAHPAREGDEQHLHGAGAARGHGRHVRRLPRAGGPARIARRVARARRACSGGGLRRLGLDAGREPFFDTLRVRTDARRRARDPRARAPARDQPARLRRRLAGHRARRDDAAERGADALRGVRRRGRGVPRRGAGGRASRPRCPRRSRARAPSSPTRSSTRTTPSTRCSATSDGSRRATSRSRTR